MKYPYKIINPFKLPFYSIVLVLCHIRRTTEISSILSRSCYSFSFRDLFSFYLSNSSVCCSCFLVLLYAFPIITFLALFPPSERRNLLVNCTPNSSSIPYTFCFPVLHDDYFYWEKGRYWENSDLSKKYRFWC